MKNPQGRGIREEPLELIDRLLLEKIPLARIARVLKVSEPWLLSLCQWKIRGGSSASDSTTKTKGASHCSNG